MTNPVVFEVFCAQEVGSARAASAPVNRQVSLRSEPITKDADLAKTNFDAATGGIAVSMNNLSADAKANFAGGKKYKVTIEPIE